ncbi:MAG: PfkB family carbohydrate kinase [Anaerolineales bacterium]
MTFALTPRTPIEYLVIGHITCDVTDNGLQPGGTAAYAALTAHALGLRPGIVSAHGEEMPLHALAHLPIVTLHTGRSTTFENLYTPQGRVQYLRHAAPPLGYPHIPDAWRTPRIVHLGPVAQEVEPDLARRFPDALLAVTPQGWLRGWDANGRVYPDEWVEANFVLRRADCAVMSVEDVQGDEHRIEEMASACPVLVVTEGAAGARLYWNGDVRRFRAPEMPEVDATGAGDIFAAAFFIRYDQTRDPWEAARFATLLAANSVTRRGLLGAPTPEEVLACTVEVL